MKRCLLLCSLVAAVFAFSSCSTTRYVSAQDDYNAMWRGHSYAEIINAYGAPDRETADGADGIILVYERTTVTTSTSTDGFYYHSPWLYGPYYGPWGPTLRTTTTTDNDYVHFYVNNEDKCYAVRTNQMKADGKQIDTGLTIATASLCTLFGVGIIGSIIGACCAPVAPIIVW